MTIRTLPNQAIPTGSSILYMLYYWFNFMRTASPSGPGWTVPLSSNGLVGGSGDNIASVSDLNRYVASTQRSWFVLRSPDGGREFLFFRISTANGQWQVHYSPSAGFTGGDAWNYPSATDSTFIHNDSPTDNFTGVLHVAADDADPYGFWAFCHVAGSFTSYRYGMIHIPIDVAPVSGDLDPFAFYYDGGGGGFIRDSFTSESYGTTEPHCYARNPSNAGGYTFCTPLYQRNINGDAIPDYLEALPSGEDVHVPIMYARRSGLGSGFFKGVSSFARWNGRSRSIGETFDALTRISIGAINVPWDGSSTMNSS